MPNFVLRKPEEVPAPTRASRAIREQQSLYEGFIRSVDGNVGELELSDDEQLRSTKVRLRRAATRLGVELEIWDADNRVYFRRGQRKRGRPRKNSA